MNQNTIISGTKPAKNRKLENAGAVETFRTQLESLRTIVFEKLNEDGINAYDNRIKMINYIYEQTKGHGSLSFEDLEVKINHAINDTPENLRDPVHTYAKKIKDAFDGAYELQRSTNKAMV